VGSSDLALGEAGRERAAGASRDYERGLRDARRARLELAGAETHAHELERSRSVVRPVASGDARKPEPASEAASLEVDRGEDGDADRKSGAGVVPERCFEPSLARSQAAYEPPAAVSLPVNRIVRMSE